ncbi:MAG: hypothetical protein HY841_01645 [Bacteroidetes bacterium]|nr:hypothetical protein [Bacteroidota bacterium]
MKQQQTSGLLNWNPTKGNPFDYQIHNYKDTISNDTEWKIEKRTNTKEKPIKQIYFFHHLKTLASLNLKFIELLNGVDKGNIVTLLDKQYIDCTKPIVVWFTYPFSQNVKATIYPLVRTFDESKQQIISEHAGYLIWQIARVYAEIYQNHWESVGIYGHGFADLYLEGLEFFKNNEVELLMGA